MEKVFTYKKIDGKGVYYKDYILFEIEKKINKFLNIYILFIFTCFTPFL